MVADHLSRLENLDLDALAENEPIHEEFLDEYLFFVDFTFTRYADYAIFLASDILSHGLSYQQKKKFFSYVKQYLWEEPYVIKVSRSSWMTTKINRVTTDLLCTGVIGHPGSMFLN